MCRVKGPVGPKLASVRLVRELADLGKVLVVEGQVENAQVLELDLREDLGLEGVAIGDFPCWELPELFVQFLDDVELGMSSVRNAAVAGVGRATDTGVFLAEHAGRGVAGAGVGFLGGVG